MWGVPPIEYVPNTSSNKFEKYLKTYSAVRNYKYIVGDEGGKENHEGSNKKFWYY